MRKSKPKFYFSSKSLYKKLKNDVIKNDVISPWKIIFRLRPHDFQIPR